MNLGITESMLTLLARLGWTLARSFIWGDSSDKPPNERTLKFMPALECEPGLEGVGRHIERGYAGNASHFYFSE